MKFSILPLVLLIVGCASHSPTLAEQNLVPRNALVVTGTIQHVQRDWTYEKPCGILANFLNRCDDVQAFEAEIVDSVGHKTQLMFFRHSGAENIHPMNGDTGTYVLHWNIVYPYLTCAQRSGMTSACMPEFTWQIESDGDMKS